MLSVKLLALAGSCGSVNKNYANVPPYEEAEGSLFQMNQLS